MYRIHLCSPKAKLLIGDATSTEPIKAFHELSLEAKYPLAALHIGHCFIVKIHDVKEKSFRSYVCNWGRDNKKKITVIKHKADGILEVARVG